MAERDSGENLSWFRFFAAVVALALVIMMVFAMFSTRNRPYTNGPFMERFDPGGRVDTFQDNVDRGIQRGFGETL